MKSMSVCVSSTRSNYQMYLYTATGAEMIYSVEYGECTVYLLIHTNPRKTHAAIDKKIIEVDNTLKRIAGSNSTSFVSISDVLSGKVKTFQTGEHATDEHYNAIFSNKVPGGRQRYELRPGVKTWTPAAARDAEALAESARHEQDLEVQEQAMEEDPSAFGVAGGDIPRPQISKKRLAEPAPQPMQQTRLDDFFNRADESLKKVKRAIVDKIDATHDKLDAIAEKQESFNKLIEKCDHFEHMTYKLRGQLGAMAFKENKKLRGELDECKEDNRRLEERLERIEDKLDQLLSRP